MIDALFCLALLIGVGASLTFIVGYAVKARGMWYHYPIGWNLMGMAVVTAVAMGILFYSIAVEPVGHTYGLILATALDVALIRQSWMLLTSRGLGKTPKRRWTDHL